MSKKTKKERCSVCRKVIRTMCFKRTGVCCNLCLKARDGD